MTKFIAPFFFLILFACTPNEEESSSLNSFQGVFSSEPPLEADVVFYKDIPYGSGDREKMDLLLPNNKALEGLVVFFHGGSFQFGSKEDLYREELQPILKATLENNIAFASVGYTFITDAQSEGVFTALENGSDAIDFLRKNSAALNIPSNIIILAGFLQAQELHYGMAFLNKPMQKSKEFWRFMLKAVTTCISGIPFLKTLT